MRKMDSMIYRHWVYFTSCFAVVLISLLFIANSGKEASFLSLNSYHPAILDDFFIIYTFLGDGIFALIVIALMYFYFKRKQEALALLYGFLISGVGAQILKHLIRSPRPRIYFDPGTYHSFIEGVTLSGSSGFPSGHTATAFAMATVLVLIIKNKKWQLPIFVVTLLVGYSRIYLAHHFLVDVVAGAVLGLFSGVLAFHLFQKKIGFKRSNKEMQQVTYDPGNKSNNMQTT